ncbi:hypothetical protein Hanom_Chr06g00508021 [Helianthus anomalus]
MNGRNKKNDTDIGKNGDLSIKYRSSIGQISDNIADIIGIDILTNIVYRYLGRGPITDISLIYRLIYRDISYIVNLLYKIRYPLIIFHYRFSRIIKILTFQRNTTTLEPITRGDRKRSHIQS